MQRRETHMETETERRREEVETGHALQQLRGSGPTRLAGPGCLDQVGWTRLAGPDCLDQVGRTRLSGPGWPPASHTHLSTQMMLVLCHLTAAVWARAPRVLCSEG